MSVTAPAASVEDRIEASVTQRVDGRWAWDVRVNGHLFTWWVLTPDTSSYEASAFGDCRWESTARRKARRYARTAARRIADTARPPRPAARRGTSSGGPR